MNTRVEINLGPDGQPKQSFWHDIVVTKEECTSERAKRLAEYWDKLRGNRSMPGRKDIDPTEIWSLVPNIHVSEWYTNPERVRYRLAGTELVASIGREISGRWLNDLHEDPRDIEETLALYRRVVQNRAPVFGRSLSSSRRLGVDSFEWVICPLSDDDKEVTHFIGLEDYVSKRRYLSGRGC
ncbi:MAG TPA: PAS domain-containing protein [Candidatus Cybelea sp.]|nr:PAS domain-containing protein [Candidatus Cybelea sp.]